MSNQLLLDSPKSGEKASQLFADDGKPILRTNRPLALVAVSVMCLCSVGCTSTFKIVNQKGVTAPEWFLWRNLFNWLLIWCFLIPNRKNPLRDTNNQMPWIWGRCLLSQCVFSLMFFTATLLPIFILMILIQTSPLWACLFGSWVNKEPVHRYEYLAMGVCFLGVCQIALSKSGNNNENF